MTKGLSIIGSTGSIGKQALNVAKHLNLNIKALVTHSNLAKLKEQADEFNPKYIGVINEKLFNEAKNLFSGYKLVCGSKALDFSCSLSSIDMVLIAVTGLNGIYPLISAIKNDKKIAIANKESIVSGGKIVNNLIKKCNAKIIPVDSEHSAIFQCLEANKDFNKLILTASGGAFYDKHISELNKIIAKDIFHPTWNMGRKITIDSCTMMNKALEIIEARWLFDTKNIDYCIHPNSIIHSMVEFNDGSILSQMSNPSMELPIQYALTYPNKYPSNIKCLDLTQNLIFKPKREDVFIAPRLAKQLIDINDDLGAVFNAANEAAVKNFEEGNIGFMDIALKVEAALQKYNNIKVHSIDDIIEIHNEIIKEC
ncbi:MAG: 1-deoxy-D-xylulose-5-phosphate reductoisomerase [Firmicutes bacterium]|nr:1-deoxy-D-xylulose-5-phosphate reductoisomerase [Bacillota bacterium]